MNIFSEEDVPDIFWEISQDILESDAVKADSVRGPPADGRTSREYWRPSLTKAEWDLLNRTMDREIETSDKYIDEATKWLYANSKGQKVFAIYGIGDGTVPTPLYAVGWKKADADYIKLRNFMEVGDDGIDTNGIRFGKGLKIVPNEQGKTSLSVYANGRRISASGVDSVSVGTSTSNGAGDTRSREKNSSQEIKFSREHSLKVNTFLRHFTGEVREGEYIYLSNIEKATIKSNIKSRNTYLSKNAVDGLVWAHSLTKQYAYTFLCNPDYSVTVTDVLDAERDIAIINRITERMENYGRTGASIRRNSGPDGQSGNGKNGGDNSGSANAQTSQSGSTQNLAQQSSGRNRQGSVETGTQNRTNSGANTPRSAQEVTGKASREFSYEWFTQKPDMVVTTLDGKAPTNRADVVHKAKQNAAKIGKFNTKDGSVSVHVDDINTDVVLGTSGLKHGLDRRFAEMAPVTIKAGDILKNSIKVNELTPEKQKVDSAYVLVGVACSRNGSLQIVRSVINRYSNELTSMDVLYAINAKKGTAALNAPRDSTPSYRSAISIAELLEYVNEYFPDVLPEDVLKYFGHDSRPEGNLGESALFSREFVQGQMDQQKKQLEQVNAALEKENGKLKEDNQYLKELVKLQKTVTNGTKFTKTSVIAAARMLKKKANVKHNANPAELVRLLEDFYGYIARGDEITWESVMEAAQPVVGV